MEKYVSKSAVQTQQIAAKLAKTNKNHVFALTGELGAGKTTFVQGFARGLGIKEKIISPTFVLIRQHQIPNTKKILYHIDLYRLEDTNGFKDLGLDELWSNLNNIVLIEWAEKAQKLLPKNTVWVSIDKSTKDTRLISIKLQ